MRLSLVGFGAPLLVQFWPVSTLNTSTQELTLFAFFLMGNFT